ncbi:uncharacterized protein [Drosophila kikkawai]|uniref:Reverse transcriptase n=1 Tax=Drosophila kikkawai TaxID=30033 RepID=A0ABM4GG74_DROKI
MIRSAKKNKNHNQNNQPKTRSGQQHVSQDPVNAEVKEMDLNTTFFLPPNEVEDQSEKEEIGRNEIEYFASGASANSEFHHTLKFTTGHEEVPNNNELSEVLKLLAAKIGQSDSNRNAIPIESSSNVVPDFDGVSIPIKQWIKCFDENADAYELTTKQKYVNARMKMKGTAKLFLESTTVSTYENLTAVLLDEFDKSLISSEVHKQLGERKKNENENFHEYVLHMRKIAAQGLVEDESVIRYIADGRKLSNDLKYPLYSAPSLKELRSRFETIEMMTKTTAGRKQAVQQSDVGNAVKPGKRFEQQQNQNKRYCFNCGSPEHMRAECKEETKCFKCSGSGHTSRNCRGENQNIGVISESREKTLTINNKSVSCLVATGADVSLMRFRTYKESHSDVASKVVLAKKKDNTYRLCIDYRVLNTMVLKDRFPVPLIEEVLDKMQGAKYFSAFDLKNGFFHVEIDEPSRKYTAFVTKEGLFEFNRAPFGFCNSPAVFVRYVTYIFQQLINKGVMEMYIDDIVVFGRTVEVCLNNMQRVLKQAEQYGLDIKWSKWSNNMQRVLKQAEQYGLDIKWSKCPFLKERINFLGYEVENGDIWPGKEKVKAVKNFPMPINIRGIQAFLGLTGYFHSAFKIEGEQKQAIEQLKSALIDEPVLKIWSQSAKTQLHVDASKHGFGGTLLQQHDGKWYPVFYWSKKTTPQEERLTSYVLEVKAAYLATKRLRHYLLGTQFDLVTDCAAFKQTISKKDIPREVTPWLMYLQDFTFNAKHLAGTRMQHVDSLSRFPFMIVTSEVHA